MEPRFLISTLAILIGTAAQINAASAAKPINLRHQPLSVLQTFTAPAINGLRNNAAFKQMSVAVDLKQNKHTRMQQMYAGYPVWGGDFVIHAAGKNNSTMNGIVYQGLESDLPNPPPYIFNAAQADKALQTAQRLFKEQNGADGTFSNAFATLMVYVDAQNQAHWAFKTGFRVKRANSLPNKPVYILDAITFAVYKQWDDLKLVDAVSAGGFGGNEKEGKFVYDNSKMPMHYNFLNITRDADNKICYLENTDVLVVVAAGAGEPGDPYVRFNCDKIDPKYHAYWSGALEPANGAYSTANDAMYSGDLVTRMYHDWYNMPPLRMQLVMRIHDPIGDNAYWDDNMTNFGDGDEDNFYPFVSLSVIAHEVSHGFTEQHSNLQYLNESGGLNEAFSDMAAKAAEYYQTGTNKDWELGAEFVKTNHALRYMDNPRRDCVDRKDKNHCSIDNANDFKPSLNVHNTSGVFNKAFYLLATAPGWNTHKAFDVMVEANMMYWTENTSFQDAACGVMEGTKDYGYDTDTVTAAFAKVGIDTGKC